MLPGPLGAHARRAALGSGSGAWVARPCVHAGPPGGQPCETRTARPTGGGCPQLGQEPSLGEQLLIARIGTLHH
jgi:hypothetical protein